MFFGRCSDKFPGEISYQKAGQTRRFGIGILITVGNLFGGVHKIHSLIREFIGRLFTKFLRRRNRGGSGALRPPHNKSYVKLVRRYANNPIANPV